MTDGEISLKCVCRQIVLFHENDGTFGSDKVLKRCLLGLKYAIFLRSGALSTYMKQQSV